MTISLQAAISGSASRKTPTAEAVRIMTDAELRQLEADNIRAALKFTNGKVSGLGGAVELLRIEPTTLIPRMDGKKGHDALRKMGTMGIQCPVRFEEGKLVGTARLHDSTLKLTDPEGPTTHAKWLTAFNTHSGKALLIKSPWELFADFYARIKPDTKKGEFWLTCGRINKSWQSGFDDLRKPTWRQGGLATLWRFIPTPQKHTRSRAAMWCG